LADVAGEYVIVFTLDWDQQALLVEQSDLNSDRSTTRRNALV
jgi:hypothetical protein